MSYPGDGVGNGMTLTEFLNGIRGRVATATKGPWYLVGSLTDEESGAPGGTIAKVVAHQMLDDGEHCKTFIICEPDTCKDSDAALIASSPTDLALAVEVISQMRDALEAISASPLWNGTAADGSTIGFTYTMSTVDRANKALAKIDALLKGSGE